MLDLPWKLGSDADFERKIAAVVSFGETRLDEDCTPGEIELELSSSGIEPLLVSQALPMIELLHRHRIFEQKGFEAWKENLAVTDLLPGLIREVAGLIAFTIGLVLLALLALTFGAWLTGLMSLAGTAIGVVLGPFLAERFRWVVFWIGLVRSKRRVARLRRKLALMAG